MIKIIGFDLDDTLLDSKKEILDIDAVKEAISRGVKIVFCSGRPLSSQIRKYYNDLGIVDGYYCGYNGTTIYDLKTGKVIDEKCLSSDDLNYIINIINNALEVLKKDNDISDIARCIHYGAKIYADHHNEYIDLEGRLNQIEVYPTPLSDIAKMNACKFMVDGKPEIIAKLFKLVESDISKKYNIMISMPCFMEIINKESNKYLLLKKVADLYGFAENEIMSFGDSMNDYELVANCVNGVAMLNSVDEIKKVAKYVTDTNDNHGIKKALKRYKVI